MLETLNNYKSALGVFYRTPEYGRVKRRLAAQIGDGEALRAYQEMLDETMKNVQGLKDIQVFWFYEGGSKYSEHFQPSDCCLPQKGRNLGQRMSNATAYLFKAGYKKVVLIGSDSPDLPLCFIQKAFSALDSYQLAIGPAKDGGYYLIGMNRPLNHIFRGIIWGQNDVLKKTLLKADEGRICYFLLPEWSDIDDLTSLRLWKGYKYG